MRNDSIALPGRCVLGSRLACVLLCAGVALLMGCERSIKVPALHGRVVDARTGEPIAGAVFRTRNYRAGAANLEAPRLIGGSTRESTTGEDGRFELPGFVAKEISGIGWLLYAPGYMVGSGCYSEEDWPPGGCSGFGLTDVTDPWVRTSWQRGPDEVEVELRLFPPTLEGVTFYTWVPERQEAEAIPEDQLGKRFPNGLPDPWEEHFRRLKTLAETGLPIRYVVSEIERYVKTGSELTDEQARMVLRVAGRFNSPGSALSLSDLEMLLSAVESHCAVGCAKDVRDYLEVVLRSVRSRPLRGE